jgi:hypothetical protein
MTNPTPLLHKQEIALGVTTPLISTPFFASGYTLAAATMPHNEIAVFGGPAGTGKTTCARYVAQNASRACALVTVPQGPAPLDLLRYIYLHVTGHAPSTSARRFNLQNLLLKVLPEWGGVLVIDEMQNSRKDSMAELVYLYEQSNHAFALIMVGTHVIDTIKAHPQLDTRVMGKVLFQPLSGPSLINAVQKLDARLAATDRAAIAAHDSAACNGLLRTWVMTIKWMDRLAITGTVSPADFAQIATLL